MYTNTLETFNASIEVEFVLSAECFVAAEMRTTMTGSASSLFRCRVEGRHARRRTRARDTSTRRVGARGVAPRPRSRRAFLRRSRALALSLRRDATCTRGRVCERRRPRRPSRPFSRPVSSSPPRGGRALLRARGAARPSPPLERQPSLAARSRRAVLVGGTACPSPSGGDTVAALPASPLGDDDEGRALRDDGDRSRWRHCCF